MEPDKKKPLGLFGVVLAAGAVGWIIGMLTAPEKGTDMRGRLKMRWKEMMERRRKERVIESAEKVRKTAAKKLEEKALAK